MVFVSHSMGGLVVMNALTTMAKRHDANLERIPLIVMTFGTPHLGVQGAEVLESLRVICPDKQAETMKVFDTSLSDLRTDWDSYFGSNREDFSRYHVNIKSYYGAEDLLIARDSACGRFFGCEQVDGNHVTMIKPSGNEDVVFRKLRVQMKSLAEASDVSHVRPSRPALEKSRPQQGRNAYADNINFNSTDKRKSTFMIGYCPGDDCFAFERAETLIRDGVHGQVFLLGGGGFIKKTESQKATSFSLGRAVSGGSGGERYDFADRPHLYIWDDAEFSMKGPVTLTALRIALWVPLVAGTKVVMKSAKKDVSLYVTSDSINDIQIAVEVSPGTAAQ